MFGIFGKVQDPVCKMEIDEKKAKYFLEYKGKKYYFCSENCQKKFAGGGDQYVAMQKMHGCKCC